ncbi:hypothetical protein SAMN05421636_108176 [Pricia antarctica]|uniref:Uncharacterized protein n=2 Tax=Pricia antarctica TaxID=641691 RepID=A0A1G7GJZ8_9FLAO|nr:hypothetical protein SAMN05421636_108176 [Pricia antarctica]
MLAENDSILAQGVTQVTKIEVSGNAKAYTFDVTIESPDTGCDQYADWWEVVDLEGHLVHRRILDHSHVKEQPFMRSGENIVIAENKEVYVRMHMNNSGYAKKAQKGSVENGFQATELDVEFAKDLEKAAPLPDGCAF